MGDNDKVNTAASQAAPASEGIRRKGGFVRELGRHARQKKLGAFGGALLLAMVFVAVFATWVAPHGPLERFPGASLLQPNRQFLLGTDQVGRDLLSRLIHGARISLFVGFTSVMLAAAVGTTIGLVSGYFRGSTDMVIQRIMDTFMSIPTLMLAMVIMAVLGPSLFNVVIAIAMVSATHQQRVVRATVLSVKENDYIEAAKSMGAGSVRILTRHVLPNITAVILVQMTLGLGAAILTESSLSFLGMGVPPPYPTWGGMLAVDGRKFMFVNPWLAIWPGLAIGLTVLGINLFGDAVRDIWDPRLRGR